MDKNFEIISNEPIEFLRPDIILSDNPDILYPKIKYLESKKFLIQNKKNKNYYHVYYSMYNIEYEKNKNIKSKTYWIIDQIVPYLNQKILPFGVYSNIIRAGILNYKMYEYMSQSYGREINHKNYYFIGQFLTNLWPLNTLRKKIIIRTNISGKIKITNIK